MKRYIVVGLVLFFSGVVFPIGYAQRVTQVLQEAKVPDLKGRTLSEAQVLLKRSGLALGQQSERETANVRPGIILAQSPTAGNVVPRGTAVHVSVAVPPQSATVPELRNRSVDEVAAILARAKLLLGRQTQREVDDARAGTVIDQSPRSGTFVRLGTSVSVVVAVESRSVRVPELRGRTAAEAAGILARAQLKPGQRRETDASGARPGTVIDQSPEAGSVVPRGKLVDVVVAVSPAWEPLLTVPEVTGRQLQEVGEILAQASFRLGQQSQEEISDVSPGTVIRQAPIAGTQAPRGTPVNVVVALPPARALSVPVPELLGADGRAVSSILSSHELRLGRQTEQQNADMRPGTVMGQFPLAGTLVSRGTPVDVIVAVAPPRTLPVPVPDLVGTERNVVSTILNNHELRLGRQTVDEETGQRTETVVRQSPPAGTLVARGTAVDVVIAIPSAPEPLRTVPNLIGRSLVSTAQFLESLQLRMGSQSEERSAGAAPGIVIGQSPAPGSQVVSETPVDVVVSIALLAPPVPPIPPVTPPVNPEAPPDDTGLPALIVVPEVRGLEAAEAARTLELAGLRQGFQQIGRSNQEPGTVIEQDPQLGTAVARQTPVRLVLVGVVVPDLAGLRLRDAQTTLIGLRLLPALQGQVTGMVAVQLPAPGTLVPAGSTINLALRGGFPFGTSVMVMVLAIVAAAGFKRLRERRKEPSRNPLPLLEVRAHRDRGRQHIANEDLVLQGAEIRVRFVRDAGKQVVREGTIVKQTDPPWRSP